MSCLNTFCTLIMYRSFSSDVLYRCSVISLHSILNTLDIVRHCTVLYSAVPFLFWVVGQLRHYILQITWVLLWMLLQRDISADTMPYRPSPACSLSLSIYRSMKTQLIGVHSAVGRAWHKKGYWGVAAAAAEEVFLSNWISAGFCLYIARSG